MISIICSYTNHDLMQNMLLNSLSKQTYKEYETVLIDSKNMGFKSACSALNYGAEKANGDLLIFVHQDVELLDNDFLEKVVHYAENNQFGIAGVAGTNRQTYEIETAVFHGPEREIAGKRLKSITEGYTLDECLFIIKKDEFKGFRNLGNTWHLYSVEYCLRTLKDKKHVVILPFEIYHLSNGSSINGSYYTTLFRLGILYFFDFRIISTCSGTDRNDLLLPFRCLVRKRRLDKKKRLS